MRSIHRNCCAGVRFVLVLAFCSLTVMSQTAPITLQGRVVDERGDVVVGAVVKVDDGSGVEKSAVTDSRGVYFIQGLAAGEVRVSAEASGFAGFAENVNVSSQKIRLQFDIELKVVIRETMRVQAGNNLSISMDENGGQVVLDEALLDSLPDDPDQLASALGAMVGASAGSQGVEVLVDGVKTGRLPSKDLIREVRINRNPFSAEYDHPGANRVEVFTKPGTEKLHGQAFVNLSSEGWNSRNPFSPDGAAFRSKFFGGSLSGSPISSRITGFLNFERRDINDEIVVNATVLDPLLNISSLGQIVSAPNYYTNFSSRADFLIDPSSTLSARYNYAASSSDRAGLTAFTLPSTSYYISNREQSLTLSFLKAFSGKTFSDSRFLYAKLGRRQNGDNSLPTINVLESFLGGGSQMGSSSSSEQRWEFANNVSWTRGHHSLRVGARARHVHVTDVSLLNYGGTFLFSGGLAPALDSQNRPVLDGRGLPKNDLIPSIERYRRTLALTAKGLSPEMVRELGGGATQFTITAGRPKAEIGQLDFGGFLLDEWQVRRNMTFSFGFRYESQTNINGRFDIAPRLALVWAPGGKKGQPTTVIRIGSGLFYDRVNERLSLEALRYSGDYQHQFVVSDDTETGKRLLNFFPNLPPMELLSSFPRAEATRRMDQGLRSPYMILTGVSVDRQLPHKIMLTTTYAHRRRLHDLRSRNINAPGPDGLRPLHDAGNIFEFESEAMFNQHQLTVQTRYNSPRHSLFASYTLSKAESDSDGPFYFPADSSTLAREYGRTALDIRHSFVMVSNLTGPWGLALSPLLTLRSGIPYNITTGTDSNLDGVLTDRPALTNDAGKPGVRQTSMGLLDPHPGPDQKIIPRNFGSGPGFFQLDLRLSKTITPSSLARFARSIIGAGSKSDRGAAAGASAGKGREKDGSKLTLAIQVYNLTNRTNLGATVGNVSSPLFGRSNSIIGGYGFGPNSNPSYNRRVELQARYSF